jgi:hypothetical protein
MNFAKIVDGTVINIEVADEEWAAEYNKKFDDCVYVLIPENVTVNIGSKWNDTDGFEKIVDPSHFLPNYGEEWDLGDLTEDQNYDELTAELEAILAGE